MELTPKAQVVEQIKQARKLLILTHTDPDGDATGSLLALRLVLQKIGKEVDAVFSGRLNDLSFLAGYDEVKDRVLEASNDLIISIDTRHTGEDLKLGYKKRPEEHRISIIVTPPKGTLLPEDVAAERSTPKYDLVVILDAAATGQLGALYDEFPDLFYETPTVVIDHHATNNYFGKINWIDLTATSTAEMLVALIESLGRDEPLIDEQVATCLLTGLITDTGSFQNLSTTPKSLTVAAQLVAAGARHQEIMERLRAKKLSTLKLWGRVLTKVAENAEGRFVWTEVTGEDFTASGAAVGDDSDLIDELLKTVVGVDFVMVLSERADQVNVKLRSVDPEVDVAEIAKIFGGGGHKAAAAAQMSGRLEEVRAEILAKVGDHQAAILRRAPAERR